MVSIVSRRTLDGDVRYIDTSVHENRVIDAVGPNVFKLITDFTFDPVDVSTGEYSPLWIITKVGASTFKPGSLIGGNARMHSTNADNDGLNVTSRAAAFRLTLTNNFYYGVSYTPSEATQCDFFLGIAVVATDILGSPPTDMIGFRKVDGSTSVALVLRTGGVETTVASILTQDTGNHVLEFYYAGDVPKLSTYVDGSLVSALTSTGLTNMPDGSVSLTPSMQWLTGEAVSHDLDIDYLRCIQIGRN